MNMKKAGKILALIILGLFMVSFLVGIVSAQTQLEENVRNFIQENILGPFFGDKEIATRSLFAILLFLLLYSIVPLIFGEEKKVLNFLISVVITALALLWTPSLFIHSIRTEYGAMGAAILAVVPFLIILIFSIRVKNLFYAQLVWIFFIIYYFALYIYNWAKTGSWLNTEMIPYLLSIIAGVFIFFFLPPIRKLLFKGKLEAIEESGEQIAKTAGLLHELQKEEVETSYGGK